MNLDTRSEPIDLAGIAEVMEGNQKAVLFRAAGPEKAELVGNVMGGRARIAAAFGVKPNELLKEVQRRLRNKPEIFEVSRAEAPCQAVVLTGADADVTKLPVHLQHGADGGPYISASIDYVVDPKTGFTNVGLRRLMLRSQTETGVDLVAPSDLQAIYEANAAAGKPTPVSFVVGAHPIDHVAGVMRLPIDELGIVAMLRDAPLAVVKCITNDIRVPADAEYVSKAISTRKDIASRRDHTANSSATTARSSATRYSILPSSPAATTRCSKPRPSAARRSAAPTPRSFRRCAPKSRSGARSK